MGIILPIPDVIPEKDIIVFCPHYDDFLFTIGGWALQLKDHGLLGTKRFHIIILFSRSNYTAHAGDSIYDVSLDRIKYATGQRIIEDMECLDELLGPQGYSYSLAGMSECFARGKVLRADSEMEYPYGVFETFDEDDWALYQAVRTLASEYRGMPDTALVFPLAIREHVDHFIVRQAGLMISEMPGPKGGATFYFQEDKPYSGHADAAEWARVDKFIADSPLVEILYETCPEAVNDLAFRHYASQVDETYREGVNGRAYGLMRHIGAEVPLDRLFRMDRQGGAEPQPGNPDTCRAFHVLPPGGSMV